MPDRQAAQATESVLPEREAEPAGRGESPPPSVVHVGVSKLGEPRSFCPGAFALVHLQEALAPTVKGTVLG